MQNRIFIGIPLPPEVQSSLAQTAATLPGGYRSVTAENIHCTLLFIGEVPVEITGSIIECLNGVLITYRRFSAEGSGCGQFPARGIPSIIYAYGDKGAEEYRELAQAVRAPMADLGFADRKPFVYHATIARLRQGRPVHGPVSLPVLEQPMIYPVEKVILYRSDLLPAGPVYTPLKTWLLA